MTTQRTAVIFDTTPTIGNRYTLTGIYGQQIITATLTDLVDKLDDYGTLPSGGRVTQHNQYAIFQTDNDRRFKRVVVPELER